MKSYQLSSRQWLPTDPDTAWEFLSDPGNLSRITPEKMQFRILSGTGRPMFPGQIIHYRVAPFPGYTVSWITEITHVKKGEYFVDEQRIGPYALWHHKHFLHPDNGGVWMEDTVDYILPYGILGQWMHRLLVKNQLKQIFEYRSAKMIEVFGRGQRQAATLHFKTI